MPSSEIIDIAKTVIPYGTIFIIFWIFQDEIKALLRNGGLKVSAPGFSIETIKEQQEQVNEKERKEISSLNFELQSVKKAEQKLQELQEYTARDKDIFFLGYHFEKTYRLLFPSQMTILTTIKNYGNEISDLLARSIYNRTIWAQQFNVSFKQFMGFLIQSGLVNHHQSKFILTPLGKTFLNYLSSNNISPKLPAYDVV